MTSDLAIPPIPHDQFSPEEIAFFHENGYVVVRGLKMRKVITQGTPAVRVAQAQPPAFSRTSES